jgi:hypothetical protein
MRRILAMSKRKRKLKIGSYAWCKRIAQRNAIIKLWEGFWGKHL